MGVRGAGYGCALPAVGKPRTRGPAPPAAGAAARARLAAEAEACSRAALPAGRAGMGESTSPISVILVSSGSRGNKLLFRFPFQRGAEHPAAQASKCATPRGPARPGDCDCSAPAGASAGPPGSPVSPVVSRTHLVAQPPVPHTPRAGLAPLTHLTPPRAPHILGASRAHHTPLAPHGNRTTLLPGVLTDS